MTSSHDPSCETAADSQPFSAIPTASCDPPGRLELDRGAPLSFTFDGLPIEAYEGETIAAALLGSGRRVLRVTERRGEVRGLFCNMGICFECLVEVDGQPNRRACQHPVTAGIQVRSQNGTACSEQRT